MIHRYYREGQRLDVAGLNEITVLLDRSETELTEVGWNCWTPRQDGPPHRHGDKDQIFYVTDGEGLVRLGDQKHPVHPGALVYVPAGLVHQTITTSYEPLCYVLFNVFLTTGKEGHATFADHIEKVKQIRKKQADTGTAEVDDREEFVGNVLPPRIIGDLFDGKVFDFKTHQTRILLSRAETNRLELVLAVWPPGNRGAMAADQGKEQTVFVLEGKGTVQAGQEKAELKRGDILFVPRGQPALTETASEKLLYLCLNSLVTKSSTTV